MPRRMVKVGGEPEPVEAEIIPIVEVIEKTSQVRLQDGAILTIKATPIDAGRAIGRKNEVGQPLYIIRHHVIVAVFSHPDVDDEEEGE